MPASPAAPSFENTLVALEKSGQLLRRVGLVFNGLASANTNPALQKIQQDVAPKLAAQEDAIFLNPALFKRVEAIYAGRGELQLDAESSRLVEYYYRRFVRSGARLSDADKVKLRALNEQDASLSARYISLLLAAAKNAALVAGSAAELAGLSNDELEAAALAAKSRGLGGKWLIPLVNTTQQPILPSLENRATRERLFRASWTRTELRRRQRHPADHRDAGRARGPARPGSSASRATRRGCSRTRWPRPRRPSTSSSGGSSRRPRPGRARRRVTSRRSSISSAAGSHSSRGTGTSTPNRCARPGSISTARRSCRTSNWTGCSATACSTRRTALYGLTFKERHDIPVYQKDVRVFEVFDRDGTSMALFYGDFFARDNKNGGAWMDNFVIQSKLLGSRPVIYNVTNFAKPAPGQPALISLDDVMTMFHEFGHALHGLFADQRYPSLSGTNVARDFVELPSQFNEHWALEPTVLAHYAVHHKTGAPMPQALADRIRKAATFNQGYSLTEILAAAELDMRWHSLAPGLPEQAANAFEAAALASSGLGLPQVPPRYRSSYFLHIWANGYAAGYYAYLWAEMLDNDAFAWFTEHGGLTRANGDRFRQMILSRGNAGDYAKLYRDFRGQDPSIEPMLNRRGIGRQ